MSGFEQQDRYCLKFSLYWYGLSQLNPELDEHRFQ